MYLIVGLGNPGLKYRNTRHNAGFMAIDALADKNGLRFSKKKFAGVIAEGIIAGEKAVLLKPHTFMNNSGDAVGEAAGFYKPGSDKLIVMYDDVDLELGKLRVRASGSAGTHNGMRSIVARLRTLDFPRVRVGIGKNPPYMQLADYVLMKLSKADKEALSQAAEKAACAVEELIKNGTESAMSKFNGNAGG